MSYSAGGGLPTTVPDDDCDQANKSENPVRYGDGEVVLNETDLSDGGFGLTWGHTRSYGNQLSSNNTGWNGNSWLVAQVEYLVFIDPDTVALMSSVSNAVWFRRIGGQWVTELGRNLALREVDGNWEVYSRSGGATRVFHGLGAVWYLQGQLQSARKAGGGTALIERDGVGRIVRWQADDGSAQPQEALRFDYEYYTSGAGAARLKSVTKVAVREGADVNIRQAVYTYYGIGSPNGNFKDLKSAEIFEYDGQDWVSLRKSCYRYYFPNDPKGFAHGLKYQMGPESVRRMELAGVDPETAPDENNGATLGVAGFADKYFEYDGERRVVLERVNGGMTFTFAYHSSSFSDAPNQWKTRTTYGRPDGSEQVVYSNYRLQVILKVLKDGTREWYEYRRYDQRNRVVLKASSEAVASYDENVAGLVTLKSNEGLVRTTHYYAATDVVTGAAEGLVHYQAVKRGGGSTSPEIRQEEYKYEAVSVGGQTIFKVKERTVYNGVNAEGTAAADPAITLMGYSWYQGTLQVKQMTTDLPVVPENQHGTDEAYSIDEYYDQDGFNTWTRDELGVITRRTFDKTLGVVTRVIRDVDTSAASGVPDGWSTLEGNGRNVVTDFEYDEEARPVLELGPAHEAVKVDGTLATVRTARFTVYRDELDEVWEAQGYATGSGPAYETVGPVTITRTNGDGLVTDEIKATRSGSGRLSSSDPYPPQSSWLSWTSQQYDSRRRLEWRRNYFLIPASQGDAGVNGTNYTQTTYGYDVMDRRNRERSGGGTVHWTVYDVRGLAISTWTGTNATDGTDANPAGTGTGGNNMVKVVSNTYDYEGTSQHQPHGNGLLTARTEHVSDTESRVTTYAYDWRNRLVSTTGEENFFETRTYDNRDQVLQIERKDGGSTGALLSRIENLHDPLGRVYCTRTYGVADGATVGTPLESNRWYDGAGHVIKSQEPGKRAWTKMVYDSLGRLKAIFLCYPANGLDDGPSDDGPSDDGPSDDGPSDDGPNNDGPSDDGPSNDVTGDIVIEQNETTYDEASNVTGTVRLLRFDNVTGPGPLEGPEGTPPSRNYYTFQWTDGIDRVVANADYGTNGGTEPSRPPSIPTSTASVLVNWTSYNAAGLPASSTNPQGIEDRSEYDAMARMTKRVEYYVNGIPDGASDRTTQYQYTLDGLIELLTLQNSITGAQITRWQYGTTTTESGVASSLLLRAKIFPDSDDTANPLSDGTDEIYDRMEYAYNRLGQVISSKDQNGTIHQFGYDARGRQIVDRVTNLGTEVDGAVRRIETAYDHLGRLQLVTSYDAETGGNVVNQVKRSYDPFGQLQEDHQAHDGAVGSGTPLVSYRYEDGAGNTARLEEIIYPDGRTIELGYGAADGPGDLLSRVETVRDVSTSSPWNIASYAYLGADTTVSSAYPEPAVELTYKLQAGTGPAGDPYAGLDAFGRIIDHRWSKNGTDIERLKYGYNLAGLRQWRLDTIAHAQNKNQDNYYSYDGLGQVTARDQGQLMDDRTGIDGFPGREEDWVYDPAGNWRVYQRRANNALTLNQFRTHNKVNEIVTYDGSGIPVVFDLAGNMTRIPRALSGTDYYEATWDAWNRLVRVKTTGSGPYGSGSYSGAGIDVTYAYDGLWRRTTKNAHTVPTHFYYNADWKCVEERQGTSTTPSQQNVIGARGRNDLVFRQRFGTLAGRHYALCDNMGSKVAITNTSGTVVERYAFTAFGDLESVMTPDYTPRTSSLFDWETLFHGEVRDSETGFYSYGYRYLAPLLGRWLSRDPIEERGGSSLYRLLSNDGVNRLDYLGLYDKKWDKTGALNVRVESCEVVIVDGHGSSTVPHTFDFPYGRGCGGAGAFIGCGPSATNERIPPENQLASAPTDDEKRSDIGNQMQHERENLGQSAREKAGELCDCCKTTVKIIVVDTNQPITGWRKANPAATEPFEDGVFEFDCTSGVLTHKSGYKWPGFK